MDDIYVGVDIGGTNIRAACADAGGNILLSVREPTRSGPAAENFEDGVIRAIEEAVGQLGGEARRVRSVGVGIPGVYHHGEIRLCPNIRNAQVQRLIGHFRAREIPVFLLNDVKCAAMGERWKGAAQECGDFVFVNIGTGISAAMYLDGRLYMGRDHSAGEIGYWITGAGDTEGYAQGHAPLEEKVSGRWLEKKAGRALQQAGGLPQAPEAGRIFQEYENGNPVVRPLLDESIRYLTMALSNISILLNPAMIVLDGGTTRILRTHIGEFSRYLAETVPFPPVLRGSALDGRAGLYGAVRLAMESCRISGG